MLCHWDGFLQYDAHVRPLLQWAHSFFRLMAIVANHEGGKADYSDAEDVNLLQLLGYQQDTFNVFQILKDLLEC